MTKEQKLELYNQAKEAYYNGEPIMTDIEFDELERELGLENKGYIGTRHNPSYTVKHPVKMGSLSKVQVKEDSNGIVDWQDIATKLNNYVKPNQKLIITPKYDGCSFEIIIKNNKIEAISTRGDGEWGRDIKQHLINNFNNVSDFSSASDFILRGEVLIKKSVFDKKYSEENYVNTRSFVAGVTGADYCKEIEDKIADLSIVIYDFKVIENNNIEEKDWTELTKNSFTPEYFKIVDWTGSAKQIEEIYKEFANYRSKCEFTLDGIVFKPLAENRINDYNEVRPKDCVALKFIPMLQETSVIGIKWNIGKTGEMIPVIMVNPVEMDGKMISKCSGHNYGYLIDNKVSIGTKVILSLAGDIIPFLYKVTDTTEFSEDKLEIENIENTYIDGCHLMACLSNEEKIKKDFLNSVTSLNIPSIGPAGANQIFEYLGQSNGLTDEFFGEEPKELPNNILLVTPEDIYIGLGSGKIASNGMKAFKKVLKEITLVDIIKTCNFKLCGTKAAEQIEKYLTNQNYDFAHIPEVAYSWVFDKESKEYNQITKIIAFLGRSFEDFKKIVIENSKEEADKIPVILTGEPNNYSSKADFLNHNPQYRQTGSWKEVKIVFTNSLESNTGKMKKAREKNIEIRLY